MGRIALLVVVILLVTTVVFVGGSYLVIFWRDTIRRWKLEREADKKKQLKEANQEFIRATEQFEESKVKKDLN